MNVCRRVGAVVTCSTDWWASQAVGVQSSGGLHTNDAERLSDDPLRVIVGRRGGPERPAASTNTMSRFETEVLTQDGNVEGLGRVNAEWVDRAMTHTAHRRVVHGQFGESGASYTVTLGACAITLCSCSTSSVTRAPSCVRETCIARTSGGRCWNRSCRGTLRGSAPLSRRRRIRQAGHL